MFSACRVLKAVRQEDGTGDVVQGLESMGTLLRSQGGERTSKCDQGVTSEVDENVKVDLVGQ